MNTNINQLIMQSMQGIIHHPTLKGDGYWVGFDGKGRIPMGVGGITYNAQIGDCCMGIAGDHIEPGVSLKNMDAKEHAAVMAFSCIGNTAKVISGDAKGKTGFVTGKHGGIDHVMIYFDQETLEDLNINDRIAIKAYGQGLKLLDYNDVMVMNLDPALLDKLNIKEQNGQLFVPVTHTIPSYLMGSGLGETTMMMGDYDIMTQDQSMVEQYQLSTLRYGDLVYIEDHDSTYGPHYLKGSGSIGVIAHSDSYTSGHGPGVTIILTSPNQTIQPLLDPHANIKEYLLLK